MNFLSLAAIEKFSADIEKLKYNIFFDLEAPIFFINRIKSVLDFGCWMSLQRSKINYENAFLEKGTFESELRRTETKVKKF